MKKFLFTKININLIALNLLLNLLFLVTINNKLFANNNYNNIKQSQYYFLMDIDNGEILLSKNSDERLAPSSMTKMMTAYVVFDQIKNGAINFQNRCVIGRDAWRKSGSSMFLNYGDVVTIEDLVKGLLTVSANDAAIALAETTTADYNSFIKLMNLKAKQLQMNDSHFMNPHGLHEEGHYMTLKDLSTLAIRLYKDFPEYAKYLNLPEFTYRNITQKNRNPLVKRNYEGTIGGKTGHTNQGGYGVVALVKRENRKLVAVVNKAPSPKFRESVITELFDYGFDNYKKIYLFSKNDKVASIETWLGNKKNIDAITKEEISFNINRDKSIDDITAKIKFKSPLYAPIPKNTKIATLEIKIKGEKTISFDLFSKERVDKVGYIRRIKRIVEYKIKNLFKK